MNARRANALSLDGGELALFHSMVQAGYGVCCICPSAVYAQPRRCASEGTYKRALRYLFSTANLGLSYDFASRPARDGVYGYYNASFADCEDTKRSTVGHNLCTGGDVL